MNQVPNLTSNDNPAAGAGDAPSIAFVKALWHGPLVDACHEGFLREIARLSNGRAAVEAFKVPGAFEIPLVARRLAASGRYDAVVGAALVVDGGIYRHEFVAAAVVEGLMRVQLDSGVPVLSAVLTPHHFQDTEPHRLFFQEHLQTKGREVAEACLSVLTAHAALDRAA
ncbi:6,7-dimethyl-8-ribityllumazine synthase [Tistlia consotensis]|uniref:6,7-dimethyl-8-ribityllumazine synthase n=1 Tax=Tistlia consotensis USBA 355 TaxID=560819 RepID=A0A1Y6BYV6_9PROT|nr:6,7-dimethyl-8-ribityllumazine synthase [Tistlia consotensis]SMF32583.1 6,7-dimethyl-8-ribityllumazine synthase [Tistlia consotensis USBA 355]SNR68637.1 6,7-dimethyl-8-ribityllumazine synthase [Tistlia consotensis]